MNPDLAVHWQHFRNSTERRARINAMLCPELEPVFVREAQEFCRSKEVPGSLTAMQLRQAEWSGIASSQSHRAFMRCLESQTAALRKALGYTA